MSGDEVLVKSKDLLNHLTFLKTKETWVIRYNGNILKLQSGKSSWAKRHHAISALSNYLYDHFSKYKHGWDAGEVTKLLQEKGIIKVERIN